MKTKNKAKSEKVVPLVKEDVKYSQELINEVHEAYNEFRSGDYFIGSAEEVIKNLKDEADKNKKICQELQQSLHERTRLNKQNR